MCATVGQFLVNFIQIIQHYHLFAHFRLAFSLYLMEWLLYQSSDFGENIKDPHLHATPICCSFYHIF